MTCLDNESVETGVLDHIRASQWLHASWCRRPRKSGGFKLRQPSASLVPQLGRDVKNLLDDSVFLGEFLHRDAGPAAAIIWQLPHRVAFHAEGQAGVVRRWEPLW